MLSVVDMIEGQHTNCIYPSQLFVPVFWEESKALWLPSESATGFFHIIVSIAPVVMTNNWYIQGNIITEIWYLVSIFDGNIQTDGVDL